MSLEKSLQKHQAVLNFWFVECTPKDWFKKSVELDNKIKERFMTAYNAAINNELYEWRTCAEGRLAEIIILDQFSRNMFRESEKAFAYDSLAVALSLEAIHQKSDKKLTLEKRKFIYMPLMHSESLKIHQLALEVFSQPGLEDNYRFELMHQNIIEKFGRYPHRNKVLNRTSTAEEIEFLNQPGSSF